MTSTATQSPAGLQAHYGAVRRATEQLCEPLAIEDYVVQSMPDASPAKWHLAHTTWFFETMVLIPTLPDYQAFSAQFAYLFNSYYNSLGRQFSRPHRGLITRPTVAEVRQYRAYVDHHMSALLDHAERLGTPIPEDVVTLGLHHEQQHQELIITDLKHLLSCNPLRPVYLDTPSRAAPELPPLEWSDYPEGLREIGHEGPGFAFDNETPRHRVFLQAFRLGSRLVTCGEYRAFMEDQGYQRPELWLSDGWKVVQERGWQAPLYWEREDDGWHAFTLGGYRPVVAAEPVTHVSLYEADAYARRAGARLPTEAEWEVAAAEAAIEGNFVEDGNLHPVAVAAAPPATPLQLFGDVWEWTQSPYTPYPGFRPAEGALGEYNAK
ncbi:MAG: ergothioneine biosynthesis protein EgtB, partial [Gemmatimonadetes bacterium]|nr:ergothioneine biosynthesis protein EgtB [Gemmatimonadota bacterium]